MTRELSGAQTRLQPPVATRPSTLTGLFNAARIGRDNVTFGHLFVLVNAILQFYVWGKDSNG